MVPSGEILLRCLHSHAQGACDVEANVSAKVEVAIDG
jgi:hypothetical protein